MSLELARKELEVQTCDCLIEEKSCSLRKEDVLKLLAECFAEAASAVVWQIDAIRWGRWQDGKLNFADAGSLEMEYLQEIRVFHGQKELHLVRQGNLLKGRSIEDGVQGMETAYVDSLSRLWGEKEAAQNGFITLQDKERKLQMTIPCEETAQYYGLITRSYIGYAEETGQAGYTDYRFKEITAADGGK